MALLALLPNNIPLLPPPGSQSKGLDVAMTVHDDRSLLALQGPAAAEVVAGLVAPGVDLKAMYFSDFKPIDLGGIPCWVTRTG